MTILQMAPATEAVRLKTTSFLLTTELFNVTLSFLCL